MYHYVNKQFLKRVKSVCSDIVNQLVVAINNDGALSVKRYLIGSGAKDLVTQNENLPIDLDYNLEILEFIKFRKSDCREIKEYIRKTFNRILDKQGWGDCSDSTSVLETETRYFTEGNKTEWSIDIAIVYEDTEKRWQRLIHNKTGIVDYDSWIWNESRDSKNLSKKVKRIKENHLWNPEVIDTYLDKKNKYLKMNDHNHPSFICYIETINEVYSKYWNN